MDRTAQLRKQTIEALAYDGELEKARKRYRAKGRDWMPATRERVIVWDEKDPELGIRIYPSGRKSWVLRYTVAGRRRLMTLGRYGPMSVHSAHESMKAELGTVYGGGDPVEERRQARAETISEIWQLYKEIKFSELSHGTKRNLRGVWTKHLKDLASRRLDSVTRSEVIRLHAGLRETNGIYAANDALKLLRSLYKVAQEHEIATADPTVGIRFYRERKRMRYLDADELKRFSEALDSDDDQDVADYLRLLLLTGARPFEWRRAEWSWVDLKAGLLKIPAEASKIRPGEEMETRELPPAALQILQQIRDRQKFASRYIFCRAGGEKPRHRNWIQKHWKRIAERAKLENVSPYTLRHTHASWAVAGGLSLKMTGDLLGHREQSTTQRYAHVVRDARKAAAERVADSLVAMMEGREGEVVSIEQKGES